MYCKKTINRYEMFYFSYGHQLQCQFMKLCLMFRKLHKKKKTEEERKTERKVVFPGNRVKNISIATDYTLKQHLYISSSSLRSLIVMC